MSKTQEEKKEYLERMWTLGRVLQENPDLATECVEILTKDGIKHATVLDLWREDDAVYVVFEGDQEGRRAMTTVVFKA